MSSIWNYLSTLRTGHNYLARSGNEMFGTVMQHGINQKTVTVRTSFHHWNFKYVRYFNKSSKVQVHDENQDCITGDKVIIKLCQPLSKSKSYYVKRIVKPIGRDDYYTQLRLQALANQVLNPQTQPQTTTNSQTLQKLQISQTSSQNLARKQKQTRKAKQAQINKSKKEKELKKELKKQSKKESKSKSNASSTEKKNKE